jgi:hypothetical protein
MDLTRYTQSLVDYAEQIDDITSLTTLRDALFTRMAAGDGKTLIETAPAGSKSFKFQVSMTVEDQFSAVVAAIKIFNGGEGSSPITFIDFSGRC